jgi:hypothetical protein
MSSKRTTAQPPEGQKKIAIVGFADSWKLAPFDDPSVKVFGLNELHKYVPRWDYWIEIHDGETLGVTERDLSEGEQKRHLAWLSQDHGKPIFMQPQHCDGRFPNAVPFPLERVSKWCPDPGKPYFTSSIGMMLAWAIEEGYDWIGLYGIDLASDVEYRFQRPNAEYFIGLARGMGKTVDIAPTSAICKAGHLYGYEKPVGDSPILASVKNHLTGLKKKHDETLALANTLDGAIQECDNFLKLHEYKERGVQLKTY